jgi:hypothetical protein
MIVQSSNLTATITALRKLPGNSTDAANIRRLSSIAVDPPPPDPDVAYTIQRSPHYRRGGNPGPAGERGRTPTQRKFTEAVKAAAAGWKTLTPWAKNIYRFPTQPGGYARPDKNSGRYNAWVHFLSSVFAIPFFNSSAAFYTTDTEGKALKEPLTLTIDTPNQIIGVTFEFWTPDTPDATDFAGLYMIDPKRHTASTIWRHTRTIATLDTWLLGPGPYTLDGPAPWPFVTGDTLRILFRHRSQQGYPQTFAWNRVAP